MLEKTTNNEAQNPSLYSLSHLSSDALIQRLERLLVRRDELTAQVLAHVGEVDARKLYLGAACSSMFVYCTDVLKLSRGATYKRIHAARAARKHPKIFARVAAGRLHLSAVCLLAPHLTADNGAELLDEAAGCTKRQVEELLARRVPRPDVETTVRRLPKRRDTGQASPSSDRPTSASEELLSLVSGPKTQPAPASGQTPDVSHAPSGHAEPATTGPASGAMPKAGDGQAAPRVEASRSTAPVSPPSARRRRDELTPLSARRYKIQFTADQSLHDKLRQAQELLGDRVAPGDLAAVFEQGLDLLLVDLRRKRFGETDRPRRPVQRRRSRAGAPVTPAAAAGEPSSPEPGTPVTPAAPAPEAAVSSSGAPAPAPEAAVSSSGVAAAESKAAVSRPVVVVPGEPADEPAVRSSRYIPVDVRRTVSRRDGYQCTFVDPGSGRRCPECSNLQYHHAHPWARGGTCEASNIKLLCKAHNLYLAEQDYGTEHIARRVQQSRDASQARRGGAPRTDGEEGSAGSLAAQVPGARCAAPPGGGPVTAPAGAVTGERV